MTPTMEFTETLTVCHCWCGIALAIPANLYRVAHEEKHDVYCPLGHVFVWGDTYKEQLERERRQLAATRELLAAEERSHRGTKAALTRRKNEAKRLAARAQAGVCPCCHRTFKQLAAHMLNKHPQYLDEQSET
jgi:hypothetical protein